MISRTPGPVLLSPRLMGDEITIILFRHIAEPFLLKHLPIVFLMVTLQLFGSHRLPILVFHFADLVDVERK